MRLHQENGKRHEGRVEIDGFNPYFAQPQAVLGLTVDLGVGRILNRMGETGALPQLQIPYSIMDEVCFKDRRVNVRMLGSVPCQSFGKITSHHRIYLPNLGVDIRSGESINEGSSEGAHTCPGIQKAHRARRRRKKPGHESGRGGRSHKLT